MSLMDNFQSAAVRWAGALALSFSTAAIAIPAHARGGHGGHGHGHGHGGPKSAYIVKDTPPDNAQPGDKPGQYYAVMDGETGELLDKSNADVRMPPASTTKVMTVYVVAKALQDGILRLDQRLPLESVSKDHGPLILSGLKRFHSWPVGSELSVDDHLKATAVLSSADTAFTLAKAVVNGRRAHQKPALPPLADEDEINAAFSDMMNDAATKMGAENTHFVNPHGMPSPGKPQYSSAHDLMIIMSSLVKAYPKESGYFSLTSFDIGKYHYKGHTQVMVDYKCHNGIGLPYRCMDHAKTGITRDAKACIVASALWDHHRLFGAVLHAPGTGRRDDILKKEFDKGFAEEARRDSDPAARHSPPVPMPTQIWPNGLGEGDQQVPEEPNFTGPPSPASGPTSPARP